MIETLAKPEFEETRLDGIDCRATICRVDVTHDNEAAAFGYSEHFPVNVPFFPRFTYHHIRDDAGQMTTVMFFERN